MSRGDHVQANHRRCERRFGPFVFRTVPATHPFADLEKVIAVAGLGVLVALVLLPLERLAPWAGECRFHQWTGYPCATCGATRAFVALSNGELPAAARLNPLVTLAVVALCAYAPVALWLWIARRDRPRLGFAGRAARWSALILTLVAVLAQWVFLIADGR